MCPAQVVVQIKNGKADYSPGEAVDLNIDVESQKNANVALLAVDKAIYALNAQNKLTLKQVLNAVLQSTSSYWISVLCGCFFHYIGQLWMQTIKVVKIEMNKKHSVLR